MYSCSYVLTFLVQKAKVGEDVHENSGGAYKLTARVVSHEENNLACEKTRSVRGGIGGLGAVNRIFVLSIVDRILIV